MVEFGGTERKQKSAEKKGLAREVRRVMERLAERRTRQSARNSWRRVACLGEGIVVERMRR